MDRGPPLGGGIGGKGAGLRWGRAAALAGPAPGGVWDPADAEAAATARRAGGSGPPATGGWRRGPGSASGAAPGGALGRGAGGWTGRRSGSPAPRPGGNA